MCFGKIVGGLIHHIGRRTIRPVSVSLHLYTVLAFIGSLETYDGIRD